MILTVYMQAFIDALPHLMLPSDSGRIFHGRGGYYIGAEHLCLDWFKPVLLLTSFIKLEQDKLAKLVTAIEAFYYCHQEPSSPFNLVFQYRHGGQTFTDIIKGQVPENHIIEENKLKFHVHLLRGQNHGLFLDMRNGRNWVKHNAHHKKILNLFSYTCGFSVAAMAGGANSVVNIDMAKGALSIGKKNHFLNQIERNVSFLSHDIFKSWGKLKKMGPYDMIIADPPSNQKGSFVATKDYIRLLRRLPELMNEQAQLLVCLNAPELDIRFLREQIETVSAEFTFIERLDNPPSFTDIDHNRSLKVLHYQYVKV